MRDADLPAVLALYARIYGEEGRASWERRRRWEFYESPAAEERAPKFYVARKDGEVVGFLAGMPMRMKIGARELTTLLPCDLMAAPEARGWNLGWRLTRRLIKDAGELACSLASSDAAQKVYDALAWRALDVAPVALRPRDWGALATRRFRLPSVARRAGRALGAWVDRLTWPRAGRELAIEPIARAPGELDALWRALAPAFPVVCVRDRAFVEWRFFRDPARAHAVLLARDRARLRGFVAVSVAQERGLSHGKIMDLFCAPDDAEAARSLLRAALRELAAREVELVVTRGLHPAIRAAVSRHFPLRRAARPARVMWSGDPAVASLALDPRGWHVSPADGDEDMVV